MAESFAFQIAGQILGKVATLVVHEIGLIWGVKANLKKLQVTVSDIKSILLDASEKKKKNQNVKDWLEKLQIVLYDVDDLLDDFMTEKLRREVQIKGSMQKAVKNFFSSSNPFALRVKMSKKLQNINNRLQDLDADSKKFKFIKRELDCPIAYPVREETHSFVCPSEIIGRDDDKSRIIQLLLSSSSTNENISVLPIVGLGGLGKTTLAKLVFNDEAFASNFETRLWICISAEFDLKKLIEKIIKEATGRVDLSHLYLNQLQVLLRDTLKSTKFLLVLDDVWNDNRKKWVELKELLSCGSHGSKIIVTTRKRSTAEIMRTSPPYELEGLSHEECMTIFVKEAFEKGDEKKYPKLLEIGERIVIKCKGLPLAVKSVGSLLYTKRELREWVYIRDNDVWRTAQNDNDVLPILKLSYDEMPLDLKRCFAFCAKYPKDVLIDSVSLIDEWMAAGLIQLPSDEDRQQLEDIGKQYFLKLLSRSFFQIEKLYFDNFRIDIKIHDLVHDLALLVAGKEVLHFKYDTKIDFERTRYLLFSPKQLVEKEFPQSLLKLNKVKSFQFEYEGVCISKRFLNTLFQTFLSLRVLYLAEVEFEELPNSIENLKSLRLLNIGGNRKIKTMPNNICKLVNLQSLYFINCLMIQCLPPDIDKLRNLRSLCLTCQMKGSFPPKGVAKGLSSLQHLVIANCCNLETLSEGMQYFTTLRHLLIGECQSLTSLAAESIKHLTCLESLDITKCEKLNLIEEELKTIDLPRGLISLTLTDLPNLNKLPSGFDRACESIEYLFIQNCTSFEILPQWLKSCKSLKKLALIDCSVDMENKCEAEEGEYWPLISHIHQIILSSSSTYSTEDRVRTEQLEAKLERMQKEREEEAERVRQQRKADFEMFELRRAEDRREYELALARALEESRAAQQRDLEATIARVIAGVASGALPAPGPPRSRSPKPPDQSHS